MASSSVVVGGRDLLGGKGEGVGGWEARGRGRGVLMYEEDGAGAWEVGALGIEIPSFLSLWMCSTRLARWGLDIGHEIGVIALLAAGRWVRAVHVSSRWRCFLDLRMQHM